MNVIKKVLISEDGTIVTVHKDGWLNGTSDSVTVKDKYLGVHEHNINSLNHLETAKDWAVNRMYVTFGIFGNDDEWRIKTVRYRLSQMVGAYMLAGFEPFKHTKLEYEDKGVDDE